MLAPQQMRNFVIMDLLMDRERQVEPHPSWSFERPNGELNQESFAEEFRRLHGNVNSNNHHAFYWNK
jgi:hypothetical protein